MFDKRSTIELNDILKVTLHPERLAIHQRLGSKIFYPTVFLNRSYHTLLFSMLSVLVTPINKFLYYCLNRTPSKHQETVLLLQKSKLFSLRFFINIVGMFVHSMGGITDMPIIYIYKY